jgi:hypothetical protein
MPRYFFDIHDGSFAHDDHGVECADLDAVRRQVKRTLSEIAKDFLPEDGEHHSFSIIVRDERNHSVYTATLAFNGFRLADPTTA